MNHYFIPHTHCQKVFERTRKPALEIDSGDIVTFETSDAAYQRLWQGEDPDQISDEDYNIVTGPVAVRGAEPGDSLRIEVLDIQIHRAWAVWIPDYGPLGDLTDHVEVQPIPLIDGSLVISDRLRIPLAPMIGCIGLAPAHGSASTLEPAHPFGGNLDLRELSPGATLVLPVQSSCAWLSIGDLHAAMGTGEPAHLSLEAAGTATVQISVDKKNRLNVPRIELPDQILCVTVLKLNETLEQAVVLATRQAFDLLTREFSLSPMEAYAYLSGCVELRFGGPASAMVLAVVPRPDWISHGYATGFDDPNNGR